MWHLFSRREPRKLYPVIWFPSLVSQVFGITAESPKNEEVIPRCFCPHLLWLTVRPVEMGWTPSVLLFSVKLSSCLSSLRGVCMCVCVCVCVCASFSVELRPSQQPSPWNLLSGYSVNWYPSSTYCFGGSLDTLLSAWWWWVWLLYSYCLSPFKPRPSISFKTCIPFWVLHQVSGHTECNYDEVAVNIAKANSGGRGF